MDLLWLFSVKMMPICYLFLDELIYRAIGFKWSRHAKVQFKLKARYLYTGWGKQTKMMKSKLKWGSFDESWLKID